MSNTMINFLKEEIGDISVVKWNVLYFIKIHGFFFNFLTKKKFHGTTEKCNI